MKHASAKWNRIQDPEHKVPENEPVFLLRAQDATAVKTLEYWIGLQMQLPDGDAILIRDARDHLERFKAWMTIKTADA